MNRSQNQTSQIRLWPRRNDEPTSELFAREKKRKVVLERKFRPEAPSAREDIRRQCKQIFLTDGTVFASRDTGLPLIGLAAAAASGVSDLVISLPK